MSDNGISCFIITGEAVEADRALLPGERGARKLVSVTPPFEGKEREADDELWRAGQTGELTPILIADNWEVAIFNEVTKQDRHLHRVGTEIYFVREGDVKIEVEGEVYDLISGDILMVMPGSAHEVLREGKFLIQLVCVNCGGPGDKFPA